MSDEVGRERRQSSASAIQCTTACWPAVVAAALVAEMPKPFSPTRVADDTVKSRLAVTLRTWALATAGLNKVMLGVARLRTLKLTGARLVAREAATACAQQ